MSLNPDWLLLIAAVLKLHLFFFVFPFFPLSVWQHSKKLKCHIKCDRMLICGSRRASESVVVDFVTAERVRTPPIFTPGKKMIFSFAKVEECFRGNRQIKFPKPVQGLAMTG